VEALVMDLVPPKMMVLVVALVEVEAKVMLASVVATMVLASTAASKGMNKASHTTIIANMNVAT
jgi:hypothetical protein